MKLLDRARSGEFDWRKGKYRFGFTYTPARAFLGIEKFRKGPLYIYFHFWFLSFYVWRKYG